MSCAGAVPQHHVLAIEALPIEILIEMSGIAVAAPGGATVIYLSIVIAQGPHVGDGPVGGAGPICEVITRARPHFVTSASDFIPHAPPGSHRENTSFTRGLA